MKKIALLLLLTVVSFPAYAQEKPAPMLIATVENIGDSPTEFSDKLESFIQLLSKNSESMRGFIALSGRDVVEKGRRLKSRLKAVPKIFSRIELTRPGTAYDNEWHRTEFWLIPEGASPPYKAQTHDIDCPTLSVTGKPFVQNNKEILVFSINIIGGDEVGPFNWSVAGGRIIRGQGKDVIWVKINKSLRLGDGMNITATVNVSGLPDGGNCMDTASFSSILGPVPNVN